ncbi:SprB repeat-containing protein, partial [bacterium AH-315-C07]|nr:SprB repeat-containing protein [bacterium AH-315-C07]
MGEFYKNYNFLSWLKSVCFLAAGILMLISLSSNKSIAQCDATVPVWNIDLSSDADSVWDQKAESRVDLCCDAADPDNCIKFIVTLHPNVSGIYFEARSPGPSGAMYFIFECDSNKKFIVNQDTACVDGPGPHNITICKPGGDNPIYTIAGIGAGEIGPPITVSNVCTDTLWAIGFTESSLVWQSVPRNATYESFLSDTINEDTVLVTPTGNYPDSVVYRVCGDIAGMTCGGSAISKCDTVTVKMVNNFSVNIGPTNPTICFGQPFVALTATATGGAAPYDYLWSTGSTTTDGPGTDTVQATGAGTYWVRVNDTLNCGFVRDTVIVTTFGTAITANAGLDDTTCATSPAYTLNGVVTGVTTGQWFNGSGTYAPNDTVLTATYTPTAAEIAAGSVTLRLRTTNTGSCPPDTDSVIIYFSDTIEASAAMTPVSCFGGSNGAIDITITEGGLGTLTYSWTNGATIQDISSLTAGPYTVTIRDPGSCQTIVSSTVTQPASALSILNIDSTDVNCLGGSDGTATVTATGGTPGYTYSWSNGLSVQTIGSLSAATYTVTVRDVNLCQVIDSIKVNQPATAISIKMDSTNVTCFGGSDGAAMATASGGTAGYTYSWSNSAGTQNITSLTANMYTVTATDANGCQIIDSIRVNQSSSALTVALDSVNVTCAGAADGVANSTPAGGTAPYTYKWSSGATSQNITGLSGTTTYTV